MNDSDLFQLRLTILEAQHILLDYFEDPNLVMQKLVELLDSPETTDALKGNYQHEENNATMINREHIVLRERSLRS